MTTTAVVQLTTTPTTTALLQVRSSEVRASIAAVIDLPLSTFGRSVYLPACTGTTKDWVEDYR